MRNSIIDAAPVISLIAALLGIVIVVWLRAMRFSVAKDFFNDRCPAFFLGLGRQPQLAADSVSASRGDWGCIVDVAITSFGLCAAGRSSY